MLHRHVFSIVIQGKFFKVKLRSHRMYVLILKIILVEGKYKYKFVFGFTNRYIWEKPAKS